MDAITLTLYTAYAVAGTFALVMLLVVLFSEYQKRSHPRAKHA